MRRQILVAAAAGALLVTGLTGAGGSSAAAGTPAALQGGSFTLTGQEAASFQLPSGMEKAWSATLADGTQQTRYQQVASGATVFGGQVTVLRDASGTATAVMGAYYPGLKAKNARNLTAAEARSKATERVGTGRRHSSEYRINPATGRTFYQVETVRADHRFVTWVDAGSGAIRKSFDAAAEGTGIGVKRDTKTIDTTTSPAGGFQLVSGDGRQATYDSGNGGGRGVLMTDPDNVWNTITANRQSPGQPAGVDAHYYANVVDDFYKATFNRNSIDNNGMQIISSVHYSRNYNNAFWEGTQMVYGDGDGRSFREFSGGLDVVGHELTHGVTDYTSDLIYENESGALNESFSDMMGSTIEFKAAGAETGGTEPDGDPVGPDFLIGEDIYLPDDVQDGFRNMSDPREDDDPDHYSERYTGGEDNGGVHTNSAIPNHVYYLVVNGGKNAGCDAVGSNGHTHTVNCDETVAPLGLDQAAQVFYAGFTSLTEYANFCDARNATIAAASSKQRTSIGDAWDAVGVVNGCTPAVPPPPPCTGGTVQLSTVFATPHPYGNNGDCTWTYTGTSTGSYKVVFDKLATEKDYDYVYVRDASGQQIAAYTGTSKRAVTSPCSTGGISVRLVTDPAVTDYGFDAHVEPC
jgi:Zn-dependent metalloprotease